MKPALIGKMCFALAASLVSCGAFAEMTTSTVGGVTTYTVPANETATLSAAFPAGTTSVVKDGEGTLVLNAANGSYSGSITVSSGILRASVTLSLGTGTVTVADKARLETDLKNCGNGTCYFPDPQILVRGNGPDGNGCLCFNGTGNGDNLFAKVKLLADARFGGTGRWGVAGVGSAGNLDLNGYKLDLAGTGQFVFRNNYCVISNPGEISVRNALFQGAPVFRGDKTNHMRMPYPNGVLTFYGANGSGTGVFPWTLDIEENSTIQSSGNYPSRNNNLFLNPIVIAKGKTLTASGASNNLLDIRGGVSGEGRFVKKTDGMLYINGAMTQTGGTLYENGTVYVSATYHFSQYTTDGKIEVTNSTLVAFWLGSPTPAFSAQNIADIVNHASWAKTAYVGYSQGVALFEQNVPFNKPVSLWHNGGTVNWRNTVNGYVNLWNQGGNFLFAPPDEAFDTRQLRVDSGTLTIAGGRMHLLGEVTAQAISGGRLVVTNATVATDDVNGRLINVSSAAGSILEICAGAAVSNRIDVGNGANMRGAVYQSGGIVRNYARSQNDGWIGQGGNAYGYYDLSGGEMSVPGGWLGIGHDTSAGVFQMTGGKLTWGQPMPVSRGGYGRLYVKGGEVTVNGGLYLGEQQWGRGANLGNSWVTLAGTGAVISATHVVLCERTNNFTAVFNLNAGVLSTPNIYQSDYGKAQRLRSNVHAYLNCGGGTLRATANKDDFLGKGNWALDRVTLFKGGLTVDTAGYKIIPTDVPFQKPFGRGVKSITYSATKTGYLGSPEVYIEGGGGEGATAYVEFDAATRTIGDVVVTSPGFGYTSAPTVKFWTADRANYVTCTVELTPEGEEQECGGLCKVGTGELQIVRPCSYTGDTIISNGILGLSYLRVDVPATETLLPTGNTVRLASGEGLFFIQGRAVSLAGFGGAGRFGAENGGSLNVTDCLYFDGIDLAAGKTLAANGPITFGDNLRLEVTNADILPNGSYTLMTLPAGSGMTRAPRLNLPAPWRVYLVNGGRTLKLSNRTGLLITVR